MTEILFDQIAKGLCYKFVLILQRPRISNGNLSIPEL